MGNKSNNLLFQKLLSEGFNYHSQGKIQEAEIAYKQFLDKGFSHPGVLSNYGIICKGKGEVDKAIKLYKKSIQLYPNSPDAYCNLGNLLRDQGYLKDAEFYIRKAIKLKPNFPYAYSNLVCILIELRKIKDAEFYAHKIIKLNPNFANIHVDLGRIFLIKGDVEKAEISTLKAIRLNPKLVDAHINLGIILIDHGDLYEAEKSMLKAIKLDPNNAIAYYNMGIVLKNQGRIKEAEISTLKAIKLNPKLADPHCSLGSIFIDQGFFKEAELSFLRAIKINPEHVKSYYLLSTLSNISSNNNWRDHLFSDKILLNKVKKEIIDIYFARANIKHKEKRFKKSSEYLEKANKLKITLYPSDARNIIIDTQRIYKDSLRITSNIKIDMALTSHIFIVGMPRSGSTLIESIVSMNPLVKALGEVNYLEEAFLEWKKSKRNNDKQYFFELYAKRINFDNKESIIVTDKMLYNYQYVGLISQCIPGAKIIHCFRTPLDNILSIYRAHFAKGNKYASSLIDCAEVYLDQDNIMNEYKKQYPFKIYELNYDLLVKQPQKEIPSLISWLGWEWNNSYLSPELNSRFISTRSNVEARLPINRKSIGGWKNYKSMLKKAEELINNKDKYN